MFILFCKYLNIQKYIGVTADDNYRIDPNFFSDQPKFVPDWDKIACLISRTAGIGVFITALVATLFLFSIY